MDYNMVLTDGGMGDLICQLVAVEHNIRHNPKINFIVWVPDYLWRFTEHVLPKRTDVRPFSKKSTFQNTIYGRTSQWKVPGHTPMRTHGVDYGFHMLSDKHIYELDKKNYLQVRPDEIDISDLDLPKDYICLLATAAHKCRTFPSEVLSDIIEYVIHKGYIPVFMGKQEAACGFEDLKITSTPVKINYKKGINLIDKTNLLKSAAVLANAKAFIGMDSGLTHVAGCTDTTIVCGYTVADPKHVAPIRKGSQSYKFFAVEPDLDCPNRYFQTNNSFYEHDYSKFPGWPVVLENLTFDKYREVIDRAIPDNTL